MFFLIIIYKNYDKKIVVICPKIFNVRRHCRNLLLFLIGSRRLDQKNGNFLSKFLCKRKCARKGAIPNFTIIYKFFQCAPYTTPKSRPPLIHWISIAIPLLLKIPLILFYIYYNISFNKNPVFHPYQNQNYCVTGLLFILASCY